MNKQQILAEVTRLCNIVRLPVPEVRTSLTSINAGLFCREDDRIWLNFNLPLAKANCDYIQTVVHEVSHYVAHMRGSTGNHDGFWKKVMLELGATNINIYHNYDVSSVTDKHNCGCMDHYISKRCKLERICKHCGNKLEKVNVCF